MQPHPECDKHLQNTCVSCGSRRVKSNHQDRLCETIIIIIILRLIGLIWSIISLWCVVFGCVISLDRNETPCATQ